nr:formate dehydrogenase [uncultured Noviherbaspirillum sp.]
MNKTDDLSQTSAARRGFLQATGSAGLLGAALALLARAAPASAALPPMASDDEAKLPGGYHETEHIRKYYAKLRQL